ncbi:MAG: DUF1015 domain-containing protein [Planctomycetes bacterium]|nr:DUF1015 domain-containing protein [Planctomycetota bacterium]
MPNIFPFKAIKYNPDKIKNLSTVTTQPYDRITKEQQDYYYKSSESNFVRLILPYTNEKPDVYSFSSAIFKEWLNSGTLKEEPDENIYIYHQRYSLNGFEYTRRGIFALVDISNSQGKKIYPHEETQLNPINDRLNLMKSTQAFLEPIMLIYDDARDRLSVLHEEITAQPYIIKTTDEFGNEHTVWKLEDKKKIGFIQDCLFPLRTIIADGHHRFETSRLFYEQLQKTRKIKGLQCTLAVLFNSKDYGVNILPIHRCLKKEVTPSKVAGALKSEFEIKEWGSIDDPSLIEEFTEDIKIEGISRTAFGFYNNSDRKARLFIRNKAGKELVDSVFLQETILEKLYNLTWANLRNQELIEYTSSADEAIQKTATGYFKGIFLMNPPTVEQVIQIAYQRKKMPPKSTDFYPKLLSGLLMSRPSL